MFACYGVTELISPLYVSQPRDGPILISSDQYLQCSAVQYSIERTFFYVGEDEVGSRYVPGFGGIADFGRGVEF